MLRPVDDRVDDRGREHDQGHSAEHSHDTDDHAELAHVGDLVHWTALRKWGTGVTLRSLAEATDDAPSICIGCGNEHAPGEGCGYDRPVQWTKYSNKEKWEHVRLFPVGVGFAAAASAVIFLLDPPQTPLMFYAGVVISTAIAVVVGGMGVRAMVGELRKTRWRAASADGRDRALVAKVGGKLSYAFGETLRFDPVTWLDGAGGLRSEAVLRLGVGELRATLDEDRLGKLRDKAQNADLFTDDEDADQNWALLAAATIFGLAARGEATLSSGRYRGWGKGGSKMKGITKGAEVALEAIESSGDATTLEQLILERCQPGAQSPTGIGDLMMSLDDDDAGSSSLPALTDDADASDEAMAAALESWKWLMDEDAELVARMLEHTLLVAD